MHVIRVERPSVEGRVATFRWTVTPATALYRQTSFELCFPASVDLRRVPEAIWWRVALACLHPHWALLRPCRVVLPVALAPGEREFWLRMSDAQVAALEAHAGGDDTARGVDLVEAGPPALMEPVRDEGLVAACFSGGRDSLTQAALLAELGEAPLLVSTTSPRAGSVEHETDWRRTVMREIVRRRSLELVEVRSDFRGCWDNGFAGARYGIGVNEVTDTFLFFAVALVVAVARGATRVCLASEAEVQESARVGGAIAQHKHFMYSAVTQRALQALLEPAGVRYAGLTYPLLQFQVQRLLAGRYPDLRDLQYSCWELSADQQACSRCSECREIAFNLMADGVAPGEVGIDVTTVLASVGGWHPERPSIPMPGIVGRHARKRVVAQMLRCLQALPPARVAQMLGRDDDESRAALREYGGVRATLLRGSPAPDPEPGYRAGFLELLDEPWRDGLAAIYDEHFARAPRDDYAALLDRSLALSSWIGAPLRTPELDRRRRVADRPRAVVARPSAPQPLSEPELAPMRASIPGPEPALASRNGAAVLRVAETLLDGNELRYVTECVRTNWVSSAGSFVTRFEAAFAAEAGCRFAVACSSGTTALHLALAAAGIGPGDEVVVPAFTMIATANAVGYVGATPVFVDSDPATWNVDLARVVDAIGPRTRALVAVHTYGHPVDGDALAAIAVANRLVVVEDAAQAHGAEWRGRRAGSLGDVAAFSFYGNKIVTTGEGGMVTTNDEAIASVARELRDHGFSSERHFWHRRRAFNYRMSNLQAAVGLAQVERLDGLLAARRRNARRYRERLGAVEGLTFAPEQSGADSAHWMVGVLVGEELGVSRDELRARLAADGIETRSFFVPLHLQPAYLRDNAGRRHPVAERLGRSGLYLPSAPSLTEDDVARVADAIRGARA
ncbi:MAG: perosamine synthetase [Solirubrobacteraceae bacterium]|nr:perosamine synthetase [Solirubrobacteraceae bacterium]